MDEKKKVKLSCVSCNETYWAHGLNIQQAVDAPSGGLIPYTCPVCNHTESKIEE
jgi:hypothetical protein